MPNILNTSMVLFFFFLSLHCGGEAATAAAAAATSLWAHLPYFPPFLLSCASVCACVRVHVWLSLMLMYALGMTLIDLAALLAKYSFFPNLSLSWLLWLLISQLQKPPWMQRGFCALRLPSPSLSPSLYILCLLFFLSLVPAHLAVSLSHFRTFSLIWQQSEPCRWKSFQRISRKLICFCNKYGPTQVNTFVYFKMYKTGSGLGATSSSSSTHPGCHSLFIQHTGHTHTHILVTKSLFSPPVIVLGKGT